MLMNWFVLRLVHATPARRPTAKEFKDKMFTFITFSSPHVGSASARDESPKHGFSDSHIVQGYFLKNISLFHLGLKDATFGNCLALAHLLCLRRCCNPGVGRNASRSSPWQMRMIPGRP